MPGLFERLQAEIEQREKSAGLSAVDLLHLSDELRAIVQTIARQGQMSLADVAAAVGMPADDVAQLMAALEDKGFVFVREIDDQKVYKTSFARRRGRDVPLNIWDALADKVE